MVWFGLYFGIGIFTFLYAAITSGVKLTWHEYLSLPLFMGLVWPVVFMHLLTAEMSSDSWYENPKDEEDAPWCM